MGSRLPQYSNLLVNMVLAISKCSIRYLSCQFSSVMLAIHDATVLISDDLASQVYGRCIDFFQLFTLSIHISPSATDSMLSFQSQILTFSDYNSIFSQSSVSFSLCNTLICSRSSLFDSNKFFTICTLSINRYDMVSGSSLIIVW